MRENGEEGERSVKTVRESNEPVQNQEPVHRMKKRIKRVIMTF